MARINALRASVGVQPLGVDAQLTGLAQGWAQHMAATGVLSHSSLTAGITENWAKLGENVGVGPDNPTVWNAFLHSAEHYANLVDPAFNRVGRRAWPSTATAPSGPATSSWSSSAPARRLPPVPRRRSATWPRWCTPRSGQPRHQPRLDRARVSGLGDRRPPAAATTTTTAPPAPQPGPPPPASSERVAAVLAALRQLSDLTPRIAAPRPKAHWGMGVAIETHELSRAFASGPALDGLTITVERGRGAGPARTQRRRQDHHRAPAQRRAGA